MRKAIVILEVEIPDEINSDPSLTVWLTDKFDKKDQKVITYSFKREG